ncbi:MAG: hypothetical protein AAGG46_01925 [Planctomycetota bacterium]
MALTSDQIKAMVGMVAGTRNDEITCDECLAGMAEFAEMELAGREMTAAMQAIRDHLDFCPECEEEYQALLAALKAVGDQ